MRAIWAWVTIDAMRRRRAHVALAILIAATGATVLTAVSGARRGETALQRLASRTLPATAEVTPYQPGFDWAPIRAIAEVESLATYAVVDFPLEGIPAEDLAVAAPPADAEGMGTIERPVVLRGRLADQNAVDEAVVTQRFVDSYGKGVGDTVVALLPSVEAAQAGLTMTGPSTSGPRVPIRIVGIVRSPWFSDRTDVSRGRLFPTNALLRRYERNLLGEFDWLSALVRLKGGEASLPAFKARIAQVTDRADIDVRNVAAQRRQWRRAMTFEARWLYAFGLVALLASLALVGQAVARNIAASLPELRVLRAVGMTDSQAAMAAAGAPVLAAVAGMTAAVTLAITASAWFPIGSAAASEPDPGWSADWVVLAPAWIGVPLLVLAGSIAATRLALSSPALRRPWRRSSIAALADRSGLPVPVVVGTRFALERGRGEQTLAVRPALLGAIAGVLGVVAALTFSAAVTEAAGNRERFGQTWQLEAWLGFAGNEIVPPGLLDDVARDPDVIGVNDWRVQTATHAPDRSPMFLYSYRPVGPGVQVVLSSGRMPAASTEVVLAPRTATALGVVTGETVALAGRTGPSRVMLVTGIGFVPAGSQCADCSHAEGGWVTDEGFDSLFETYQFRAGIIALKPGADVTAVADRLRSAAAGRGAVGAAFAPPYAPSGVAELGRVKLFPLALAAFLMLLALGTVGHVLAAGVRRRRHEVAVLRALGMTRVQCRVAILTQASVLARDRIARRGSVWHSCGPTALASRR